MCVQSLPFNAYTSRGTLHASHPCVADAPAPEGPVHAEPDEVPRGWARGSPENPNPTQPITDEEFGSLKSSFV